MEVSREGRFYRYQKILHLKHETEDLNWLKGALKLFLIM